MPSFKKLKLNSYGFTHDFLAILFVVLFCIAGVGYIVFTHAAITTKPYSSSNQFDNFKYVLGDGVTAPITHSQTGELLLQFNKDQTGYHPRDVVLYQLTLPDNTTANSLKADVSYLVNGFNTAFIATNQPTHKVWEVSSPASIVNRHVNLSFSNQPKVIYFGLSATGSNGTVSGVFPANRYFRVNSYTVTGTSEITNPPPPQSDCTNVLSPSDNLQTAIETAPAGSVLCLPPASTYTGEVDIRKSLGTSTSGITITSQDHTKAATIKGRLAAFGGADYLTFSWLKLDGVNPSNLPSPTIGANNLKLSHDDITNDHTAICVATLDDPTYGVAHNTVIDANRIHDCGVLPATNYDHGIYDIGFSSQITNNYIYNNADRGIMLRGAHGSVVHNNTVDHNGEGILFGDLSASNNDVAYNIFSNSAVRFNSESYWGSTPIGTGNLFHNNCLWATRSDYYGQNQSIDPGMSGVATSAVTFANPLYSDVARADYTLQPGSGCNGFGVQPAISPGLPPQS